MFKELPFQKRGASQYRKVRLASIQGAEDLELLIPRSPCLLIPIGKPPSPGLAELGIMADAVFT